VDNEAILLLETTAGMGTEVGYRFGQIARILDESKHGSRLGVCLDTAHTFEAGYDWSTAKGFDKAAREFKREIGFPALRVIHLNDSKTPLGSRVDRHWHIGKGSIGEDGMRRLINHPPFSKLPGIMETPRKSDKDDLANLRVARRLSK
jgi:deoxyribonuclease-4